MFFNIKYGDTAEEDIMQFLPHNVFKKNIQLKYCFTILKIELIILYKI